MKALIEISPEELPTLATKAVKAGIRVGGRISWKNKKLKLETPLGVLEIVEGNRTSILDPDKGLFEAGIPFFSNKYLKAIAIASTESCTIVDYYPDNPDRLFLELAEFLAKFADSLPSSNGFVPCNVRWLVGGKWLVLAVSDTCGRGLDELVRIIAGLVAGRNKVERGYLDLILSMLTGG